MEIKTYPETPYLNLLTEILAVNEERPDRSGTNTLSIFSPKLTFSMLNVLPVITTKRVFIRAVIEELLLFISGKTDTKNLEKKGVNIWKGHTSAEFLAKRGLEYKEGDPGPFYGFQWRHWGAKYQGCDHDYTGEGIDQLGNLIKGIINDPYGRRHILTSWNVEDINKISLPPCHCFAQFYVSACGKYIDCALNQRSSDMFLGVPFNITSYCLLTYIIGHLTNKIPRTFHHLLGDAHIYLNHINQVKEQLSRTPYDFPSVKIIGNPITLEDFTYESFEIINYKHHPTIKGEMSV